MGGKIPELQQIPGIVTGVLQVLAKALNAKDFASVQSIITEMQQKIYRLQAENLELREKGLDEKAKALELQAQNDQLKHQIANAKSWERRQESYKPYKTSDGSIVYRHIDSQDLNEVFCAVCFSKERLMHLQPGGDGYVGCPENHAAYIQL